jgi:solute carrier family 25 oxoglutarate transporter 11
MSQKKPQTSGSIAINFATAGLAGVIGWIGVHPFNTAAVRLNLAATKSGGKSTTFFEFMKQTAREKKLMGLYDGLPAGVSRQVVYASSRFGFYEVIRDEIAKRRELDLGSRLLSGCMAGSLAAMLSCPVEVTLVRMSNDSSVPAAERRNYTSISNAFVRIFREEGPKAFFRGCLPFMSRAMLVGMVQVGTLDQFKITYRKLGIKGMFSNVFAASMSSGLMYSIVTMPFETVKNRMAFQKPDANGVRPYRSIVQSMQYITAREGFLGLYGGFLPYYLRCGGHTVLMFVTMEYLRAAL